MTVQAALAHLVSVLAASGGVELVPGAAPELRAVGAITDSNTLAQLHNVAYPTGVQAGMLLLVIAAWRHNDGDGKYEMSEDMEEDGWAEMQGSPFKFGNGNVGTHIFWKFATSNHSGNIPGGVIGSGGASSDQVNIICIRFGADDGFADNPFEAITGTLTGSATTNHPMQSITTLGDRRLAVHVGIFNNDNLNPTESSGETGGSWQEEVEAVASSGGDLTIQVHTAEMENAGTISGGTVTTDNTCTSCRFAFALVPASVPT